MNAIVLALHKKVKKRKKEQGQDALWISQTAMVWWLAWFTNNGKQKKRFSLSTLFSLKLKFQFVLTSI